jgi:cytosine/adenosine deaminase-related metal-dependent hydrolase
MLLIRGLSYVVTYDDAGRELSDADILVDGRTIAAVGAGLSDDGVERVLDGRGLIALPGLVNAHQHLYEAVLRAVPELERASMGRWLDGIGELGIRWWRQGRLGRDTVREVARAVLLESLLGGVTTVADQHYFFPGGKPGGYVEATIEAAMDVGVRLHAARSSITLGKHEGGHADDLFVEDVQSVVRHCAELIERYHDPRPLARIRIALGPCGVHVDLPETFESLAALAADHEQVRLHTHLYEKVDTEICLDLHGMTPWRFLEKHGWANERVWVAHAVDPPAHEIPEFAAAGVRVTHLIAPDLRLGWGIAPVRAMLDAGVTVGFGTTGSGSNDGANLLGDLRVAALAHRPAIPDPQRWLTARELFRMATRGSADCLGRPDLGSLAPGKAADIACWDLTGIDRVGIHDPLIGLLMTGLSDKASLVLVDGEVLVEDGNATRVDVEAVARLARSMAPVG